MQNHPQSTLIDIKKHSSEEKENVTRQAYYDLEVFVLQIGHYDTYVYLDTAQ